MAENDAMEGKKLELHMFEEKILEQLEIAKEQKSDVGVIENGEMQFEIKIEKIDKKIKIHAFGEEILTLEEGDKFSYNIEGLKNIKEKLEENPDFDYKQFGLPDIEYLEELEKQKKENEKEENQKDEEDLSDDMEEKDEEEPEEEKSEEETTEEMARNHNVSSSKVVHVSTEKRVTDKDTLPGLEEKTKGYKDVYMLPGEDEYSRDIIGINKDGEEEKININQIEGKNPSDINIKRIDGEEIKTVKPIAIYQINKNQVLAVVKDSAGKDEWLFCRQEEGRGKEYWGIGIPEKDTKNVREKPVEGREFIDTRKNSSYDLAKKSDELGKGTDLETRGIPSRGGKGVQPEEISGTARQNRELRKEDIIEDLLKRDGIVDRAKAMPGFYENKAEKVLQLMETNDKINYDDAVKQVESSNRQPGGNTPDEKRNKREH